MYLASLTSPLKGLIALQYNGPGTGSELGGLSLCA